MAPWMAVGELGLNTTLNETLLPAAMVVDVEIPLTLTPVPVTLTCEIVNVALPEFISVMLWELLFPKVTLPKLAEFGVADTAAWVPVPLKPIVAGVGERLVVIVTLPAEVPAAVGLNVVLKLIFCPAPITWPEDNPLTL